VKIFPGLGQFWPATLPDITSRLIPMTHIPEIGAISRAGFWYVCHAYLAPHSSVTRFRRRLEHCSTPSQKVACTWTKWWLMIGEW